MMRTSVFMILCWRVVEGFSVTAPTHSNPIVNSDFGSSDFGSAFPAEVSPLEALGIEEGDLALGLDPQEVLKYIGT